MHELGPHGELVEQFLREVTAGTTEWSRVAESADSPRQRPAARALAQVPWPTSLLGAVDKAALRAFGSLGLSDADFDDPFALGTVKVAVTSGAKAMAVLDKLDRADLETLLGPFADEGYASAREGLAQGDRAR